ncbi:MAG: Pr6Pr family membrane protein [Sphingopyxis sp.]|uniref:Pr6Pr family membrane protein n=1 Tax=Sphingopyxis sp. TaxID=1908224 RepID=UPI002AB921B1|nr:Pr6Pr family membrane protein [Sphingopyxis sp.]MDZ3831070.1 Pr6Pr family membrane protein [Sphingopyxis sp.]
MDAAGRTGQIRIVHGIAALVAWTGLGLQLGLLVRDYLADGLSAGAALWRFLGYFTIVTNLFVALVASAAALAPRHRLASPRVRFAALCAILLVGIVYSLALRHVWDPQGLQAVVDHALHDAAPLLFLLGWLYAPHGMLGWRDLVWALPFPLAYLAYAVARGAVEGWYAYYFLDPSHQGWGAFWGTVAAIVAGFLVMAALILMLDRWLARRA